MDFLTINHCLSFAGNNPVNLFVVFMSVNERHPRTGRKPVDADLCAGQFQFLMQFDSAFVSDACFRVVCHRYDLQRILAIPFA